MAIKTVSINQVKPDPNQPRKIFSKAHIKGLAENLKVEGIINPIEVDPEFNIITGECRWRAAKEAGWTEVKVNINENSLPKYERFRRQMAENLHQSSAGSSSPMNAIDVAKGYVQLLKMLGYKWSAADHPIGTDLGMRKLAKDLSVSHNTINESLKLLTQKRFVLEDIKKGRPKTLYIEAGRVEEKYKKRLLKAISEGKIKKREDIRRFKRTSLIKPEKAEIEFLRITQKQSEEANRILNRAVELGLAMKNVDPIKLSPEDKKMIRLQLNSVTGSIRNFIGKLNKY